MRLSHLIAFIFLVVSRFELILTQGQCRNPKGQNGVCVALTQCQSLTALIQKRPISAADRQFLAQSQCGWNYQTNKPNVCCAEDVTGALTNQGGSGGGALPSAGICGLSASDRIVGGDKTKIDEFPWVVLLEYWKPGNARGFHCGGVLINERYVLTAAHCVHERLLQGRYVLTSVRLGEWDLKTSPDCDTSSGTPDCAPAHIDVPIAEQLPHPQYDPDSVQQFNDIALLRLARSVTFSDFVKPICLPTDPSFGYRNMVGESLTVAGWGRTETRGSSNVKLKVKVLGANNQACDNVYRSQNRYITEKQLCAGGEKGKDSCSGDSGGPLMGTHRTPEGRPYWFLAGLVSYGPTPCGLEGWPGVYTRTTEYIDWIRQNIRN